MSLQNNEILLLNHSSVCHLMMHENKYSKKHCSMNFPYLYRLSLVIVITFVRLPRIRSSYHSVYFDCILNTHSLKPVYGNRISCDWSDVDSTLHSTVPYGQVGSVTSERIVRFWGEFALIRKTTAKTKEIFVTPVCFDFTSYIVFQIFFWKKTYRENRSLFILPKCIAVYYFHIFIYFQRSYIAVSIQKSLVHTYTSPQTSQTRHAKSG